MDVTGYIQVVFLIILLIGNGLFSNSKNAFSLLKKDKIEELKNKKGVFNEYISELYIFPKSLLFSIVVVKTFFLILQIFFIISIASDLTIILHIYNGITLPTLVLIVIALNLLFSEILFRKAVIKNPELYSRIICIPLYWINLLLFPVVKILKDAIKLVVSLFHMDKLVRRLLNKETINNIDGNNFQQKEQEKKELINSLVSFKAIIVREVMTPRVDITAVSIDTNFNELLNIIKESAFSRIPLYKDSLDNIVGIIYTKDLLGYLKNDVKQNKLCLEKIARKPMFVPETKLISDLMREFQEKKMHLGIVVDEYGGTSGLVSLEDILEEIVGEIKDEYDKEEAEIIKLNNNSFMISGKTSIEQVNETLGVDLYSQENYFDTIGGFVLNYSGVIPNEGYSFTFKNYKFTVKEILNRRINKILAEILPEE